MGMGKAPADAPHRQAKHLGSRVESEHGKFECVIRRNRAGSPTRIVPSPAMAFPLVPARADRAAGQGLPQARHAPSMAIHPLDGCHAARIALRGKAADRNKETPKIG